MYAKQSKPEFVIPPPPRAPVKKGSESLLLVGGSESSRISKKYVQTSSSGFQVCTGPSCNGDDNHSMSSHSSLLDGPNVADLIETWDSFATAAASESPKEGHKKENIDVQVSSLLTRYLSRSSDEDLNRIMRSLLSVVTSSSVVKDSYVPSVKNCVSVESGSTKRTTEGWSCKVTCKSMPQFIIYPFGDDEIDGIEMGRTISCNDDMISGYLCNDGKLCVVITNYSGNHGKNVTFYFSF